MRQPSLRTLIIALIVVLLLPFIGAALFVMIRLSDAEHQTREAQSPVLRALFRARSTDNCCRPKRRCTRLARPRICKMEI
jgi:hypothetical protein